METVKSQATLGEIALTSLCAMTVLSLDIPEAVDLSYKTDLDICDCLKLENYLIFEYIRLTDLFWGTL